MIYPEEDFLQLSGLQHFKFCRRQWALIYIENQWAENFRTTDGAILHENAHNGGFTESRGDLLVTRDMRIFSRTLGVSGACDVLEFRRGKRASRSKAARGCGSPIRWNTSGDSRRRTRQMPSSSAGRLCVWKKCSAAKFREVLFGCKQTYFPEDPMIL